MSVSAFMYLCICMLLHAVLKLWKVFLMWAGGLYCFVFILLYVSICLFVCCAVFVSTVEGIPDVGRLFVLLSISIAPCQYMCISLLRCICLLRFISLLRCICLLRCISLLRCINTDIFVCTVEGIPDVGGVLGIPLLPNISPKHTLTPPATYHDF